MTERLSWLQALEQMQGFTRDDEHPFWLLTQEAKQRLREAITSERNRLGVGMGS